MTLERMSITHTLKAMNKGENMRGERLRYLRERRGISQLELAEALNMSESQILRYENNRSQPRAEIIVDIARYFAVTTDYLLGVSDDPKTYGEHNLTPREWAIIHALRASDMRDFLALMLEDMSDRDKHTERILTHGE